MGNQIWVNYLYLLFPGYVEEAVDIAFLVDSSASVDWTKARNFIKSMIDSLDISEKAGHVAFMSYAEKASLGFDFSTHGLNGYSKTGARQLIDGIIQLGGDQRNINEGLDLTGYVFQVRAGAREEARKVQRLQLVAWVFKLWRLWQFSPVVYYVSPHTRLN